MNNYIYVWIILGDRDQIHVESSVQPGSRGKRDIVLKLTTKSKLNQEFISIVSVRSYVRQECRRPVLYVCRSIDVTKDHNYDKGGLDYKFDQRTLVIHQLGNVYIS